MLMRRAGRKTERRVIGKFKAVKKKGAELGVKRSLIAYVRAQVTANVACQEAVVILMARYANAWQSWEAALEATIL